ncbi:MAG TPA: condensation domain-containing protein, partial [Polyangiaceae bacterium]|nr:condensation domain-containing protein [Polyangiaceae bacterium]
MPTGPEYVTAFFGCLYAGIIAVPAFPASAGNAQHLQRLRGMLQDAQPRLLLTDEANETKLANLSLEGNGASAFVVRLGESGDCEWDPAPFDPDAIAFLQYTSGSTAAPKGVMVTHGNLIANGAVICAGMKLDEQAVLVSWLPLYHDMGLVSGVVVPVYRGFPVTLMSSQLILERPATWLRAIARSRATISGGPDFAFPLCVDRIKDEEIAGIDLSCWRVAFCGSEPISSQSMTSFASRFAPYGFHSDALCPCYGLAEATLMVSSARAGEGARARHFDATHLGQGQVLEAEFGAPLVDCGVIPARHRVAIVEPSTGRVCEPGRVGEIWVSGPSVTRGYWHNEVATERTFPSLPADDGARARHLRTGDLGFVLEGRVFVSGRLKDLIIVRGQNLYPQDIERALLGSVPSLRRGRIAAFPVTGRAGEGIGIAAELSSVTLNSVGADAVIAAIRRALAAEHHESAELIVLLKAGQLPRTSSGKLRRSACAAALRDGSLKPSATYRRSEDAEPAQEARTQRIPPRTVTEHALASIWAEVLGKRDFGVHDDFFEAGGESLAAANLLARVEKVFELELRLELIFEARTIERQAQLLQAHRGQPVRSERTASLSLTRVLRDSAPLSYGQKSLWFLWKLEPESSAYTLVARIQFAGELDVAAVNRAIARLVERHEPLRTQFDEEDGVPRQRIRAEAAFDWQEFDLSNEEPVRREARLSELVAQLERKPFDLVAGPLLRAHVVTLPEQRHLLLVALHHIAADAGSVAVLWRELAAFYEQERTGARRTLEPLPSQYADYALQQNEADPARFETQLAYWRERLAGERPALELPGRLAVPGEDRDEAARVVRNVSNAQTTTLRRLSQTRGATLSQLLLATFDVLLHRYSN